MYRETDETCVDEPDKSVIKVITGRGWGRFNSDLRVSSLEHEKMTSYIDDKYLEINQWYDRG